VLGIAIGVVASTWSAAVPAAVLSVSGATAAWTDLRQRRLPNLLVVSTLFGGLVAATARPPSEILPGLRGWLVGALVVAVPLLLVHLAVPSGIGFGDVKYTVAVGGCLGVIDWRLAVYAVALACVAGPVSAVVIPRWRRTIPFGFLLALSSFSVVALYAVER
jgi:leader peptidase (prepilin peptidase)/N-methyltransferase